MMNEFAGKRKVDKAGPDNYTFSKPSGPQYQLPNGSQKKATFLEKENLISEQGSQTKGKFVMVPNMRVSCPLLTDQKNKQVSQDKRGLVKPKPHPFDTTYSKDYFQYLRVKEVDSVVLGGYLSRQPEVSPESRAVMVDYFVELKVALDLSMNTIYLAVLFIDKFMDNFMTEQKKFFLIGMSTLLIASKMEDNKQKCLEKDVVLKLALGDFGEDELIQYEQLIMEANLYRLGMVTRHHYVEKIVKMLKSEKNKQAFELIAAITLYNENMGSFLPSAVIYCALEILAAFSKNSHHEAVAAFTDNNGEFELAKDYLEFRIIDQKAIEECTQQILITVCSVRQTSPQGLTKAFGPFFKLVAELAKMRRF
jgi:hypothetical protein